MEEQPGPNARCNVSKAQKFLSTHAAVFNAFNPGSKLSRLKTDSSADLVRQSALLRTRSTTCDLYVSRAIWETDFRRIQTPSRVWPREAGNVGKSLAQTRASRSNPL